VKRITHADIVGRRVAVARNLKYRRRAGARRVVWSVFEPTATNGRGTLIGHIESADGVTLTDAVGVVSGRAWVLRDADADRELVAWVVGTVAPTAPANDRTDDVAVDPDFVDYDRTTEEFRWMDSGAVWTGARAVSFTNRMWSL
jgi:hypothetical protein